MSRPYPLVPKSLRNVNELMSQSPAGTTERVAGPSGSRASQTTTVEDYVEEQDDIKAMPSRSKASVSGSTAAAPDIAGTTAMAANDPVLTAGAVSDNFGTPARIRTAASDQHHHASVDANLVEDITRYTHRGIPVEDFLKIAFYLDDAAYEEVESKIDGWDITSDGAYKEKLAAFVNAKREEDMYQPLADVGNMFLKRGEKEGNVTRELQLRVVDKAPLHGTLSKSRKPDVILEALRNIPDTHQYDQVTDTVEHESAAQALVESSDADGTEEKSDQAVERSDVPAKSTRAHVLNVLVPFEFKAAKSSNAAKVPVALNRRQRRAVGKRKMREEVEESVAVEELDKDGFEVVSSYQTRTPVSDPALVSETSCISTVSCSSNISSLNAGSDKARIQVSTDSAADEDRPSHKRQKAAASGRGVLPLTSLAEAFPSISSTLSGSANASARAKHEASGRLQLAGYATELLSARGDWSYVFGIRVVGKEITLCFYHRAGIVEATPFKLDDPELNPESSKSPIYLAIFLTRFQGDPASYGFMEDTGYANPFESEDARTRGLGVFLKQIEDPTNDRLNEELPIDQIKAKDVHERRYCLVGRGTTVVDVEMPGFKEPELVAKSSWQNTGRTLEKKFILQAREAIGKHAPELYAHGEVKDNSPLEALISKCKKKARYEPKELRILVMRKYRPLHELDDKEFWKAIVQLAICLHLLYIRKNILHRDISMGNLAYYRDEITKEVVIVLLDYDLASMPNSAIHVSDHRTGTAPFMAREVLESKEQYTHKIYHDLESVFYALVWQAAGYRGRKLPGKDFGDQNAPISFPDPLRRWRIGPPSDLLNAKHEFIKDRASMFSKFGIESLLRSKTIVLWNAYHDAWKHRSKNDEVDSEELERRARAALAEALANGGNEEDCDLAYTEAFVRGMSDTTIHKGLGITFKTWIQKAAPALILLDDDHNHCTCC